MSEGVALARERGDRSALADGLLHLALLVGHDQAQPAGYEEESLAISRDLDDPWLAALALHAVGVGALTRSDGASAHRRLNEGLALWLELGDAWFAAHALNALGDLARAESDVATAAERYSRCLELLHQHGIRHSSASVLHTLGYVRHQLGVDRAALPLFREALALFVNQGDHRGIAECLVGLGVCLLGMGAPRDAALLFGAADGLLAALGMTALPSNARNVEAAKTATQARLTSEEYAQLHAAGRAMHVGDALRYAREYAPPRSAAQSEPTAFEVLTPREREIAWLLARGQTNRQIADGLVISEQTAETHVKRILGKLQLRSRHQVAEVAELHIPT